MGGRVGRVGRDAVVREGVRVEDKLNLRSK